VAVEGAEGAVEGAAVAVEGAAVEGAAVLVVVVVVAVEGVLVVGCPLLWPCPCPCPCLLCDLCHLWVALVVLLHNCKKPAPVENQKSRIVEKF
jgi:hypothetical protein